MIDPLSIISQLQGVYASQAVAQQNILAETQSYQNALEQQQMDSKMQQMLQEQALLTNSRSFWGESHADVSAGVQRRIAACATCGQTYPHVHLQPEWEIRNNQIVDRVKADALDFQQRWSSSDTVDWKELKHFFSRRLFARFAADWWLAKRWNLPWTQRWRKMEGWQSAYNKYHNEYKGE